jgi:hypothetical protein
MHTDWCVNNVQAAGNRQRPLESKGLFGHLFLWMLMLLTQYCQWNLFLSRPFHQYFSVRNAMFSRFVLDNISNINCDVIHSCRSGVELFTDVPRSTLWIYEIGEWRFIRLSFPFWKVGLHMRFLTAIFSSWRMFLLTMMQMNISSTNVQNRVKWYPLVKIMNWITYAKNRQCKPTLIKQSQLGTVYFNKCEAWTHYLAHFFYDVLRSLRVSRKCLGD